MEETNFVFSTISALCGASVVCTGLSFRKLRVRPFMEILVLISLCECLGCIATSLGYPANKSALCPIQSFFTVFFFKASWLWIVMLSFQLWYLSDHGKFGMSRAAMHCLCWGTSLITTLLPLSEVHYGRVDDGDDTNGWCFLDGLASQNQELLIWATITFAGLQLSCILLMIYFSISTYLKCSDPDHLPSPKMLLVFNTMYLYPLAMILTWLPNLVMAFLFNSASVSKSTSGNYVFNIFTVLATQNGTLTALIFFVKSKEARSYWKALFAKYCFGSISEIDQSLVSVSIQSDAVEEPGEMDCEDVYSEIKTAHSATVNYLRNVSTSTSTSKRDLNVSSDRDVGLNRMNPQNVSIPF